MKSTQLRQALKARGYDVSQEKAETIHKSIDHDSILKKHRDRITFQTITKAELKAGKIINNIPGDVWLKQPGIDYIPDDAPIILIYLDGELSMFQHHSPYAAGFRHFTNVDTDLSRPDSHIGRMLNEKAQQLADEEITEVALSNAPSQEDSFEEIRKSLLELHKKIDDLNKAK